MQVNIKANQKQALHSLKGKAKSISNPKKEVSQKITIWMKMSHQPVNSSKGIGIVN